MKTKRARVLILTLALVCVIGVSGIMAYFTDGDTVTNEFTVGSISLDLTETQWVDGSGDDITPLKTVKKNPAIYNDGINDEFVFIEISVPYDTFKTAKSDGSLETQTAVSQDLFVLNGLQENIDGKIWTLVGTPTVFSDDAGNQFSKYVYAYTNGSDHMAALSPKTSTDELFTSITMKNVVEDHVLDGRSSDIVINAYGIQTNNLGGAIGDTANSGTTEPAAVWEIVCNASPSLTMEGNIKEGANTDVKDVNTGVFTPNN